MYFFGQHFNKKHINRNNGGLAKRDFDSHLGKSM
jgi:hypothetical protein